MQLQALQLVKLHKAVQRDVVPGMQSDLKTGKNMGVSKKWGYPKMDSL